MKWLEGYFKLEKENLWKKRKKIDSVEAFLNQNLIDFHDSFDNLLNTVQLYKQKTFS